MSTFRHKGHVFLIALLVALAPLVVFELRVIAEFGVLPLGVR